MKIDGIPFALLLLTILYLSGFGQVIYPSEVTIHLALTDSQGRFVNGLNISNFQVYESGKQLEIDDL